VLLAQLNLLLAAGGGSENGNGTYVLKIVAEVHPKEEKPEKMVFYAKKPYHRTEKMIFPNFRI